MNEEEKLKARVKGFIVTLMKRQGYFETEIADVLASMKENDN